MTMTQLLVNIDHVAYKKLIMSDKDFTALAGILERAQVVDETYLNDGNTYKTCYVAHPPAVVTATTSVPRTLYTQDKLDALRAEAEAAKQAAETEEVAA